MIGLMTMIHVWKRTDQVYERETGKDVKNESKVCTEKLHVARSH